MKTTYRLIIFFLFVIPASTSNAAAIRDTTRKNFMIPLAPSAGFSPDNARRLSESAVQKILHGSVGQGLKIILAARNHTFSQQHLDRVAPFKTLELIDVLQAIASAKPGSQDQKIGYLFVKGAFGGDQLVSEKQFKSAISKTPESNFVKRLKFLVTSINDSTISETQVRDYLKQDSSSFYANMLLAQYLYDNKRYEESLSYCDRVLRLNPNYAYAYDLRGKCYAKVNKYSEALVNYNQALKLFPNYRIANYDKANALLDLKRYSEAKNNYLRMYEVNPSYDWCSYNLSKVYGHLGNLDSAMFYANIFISQYPDDEYGKNLKGDIYYSRKEFKQSIAYYTQAIAINPDKSFFYNDRGNAYMMDKQIDSAIADFHRSTSLDSTNSYPVSRIGDCYFFSKRYEEAMPYYQNAIKLNPNTAYYYYALNNTYTELNKFPDAISAGLKAIELDSTLASAWGNLGWTYYCAGNYDKCIEYSNKALAIDKTTAYCMFNIALATLRKGELTRAKDLYTSYIKNCQDNKLDIDEGAVDDLKDLIKARVYVNEAQYIIDKIFGGVKLKRPES